VPASVPAAKVAVTKPAPPPAQPPAAEGPGMLDDLLDNGLLAPAAGVLLALLAGLGLYRLRGRARKPAGETSFLESRLQPDSFFGASGGQRVDTRDASASGASGNSSSMSYSMSQLDAIGDVDPVAEADVYLAYGRDLQAEEILKEAMRAAPDRMTIRTKLLEVYAKRRDIKAFELLATQLYSLTRGEGEDWAKAQALGLGIDPENPLYHADGAPEGMRQSSVSIQADALGASTQPYTTPVTAPVFQPASDATLDAALDLDLDLSLDLTPDEPPPAPQDRSPSDQAQNLLRMADAPDLAPTTRTVSMPRLPEPTAPAGNSLDFDLASLSDEDAAGAAGPAPAPGLDDDATLDFGDFDLGDAPPATADMAALARKLELAEEFRQIGDVEGARDLLEEVLAKSEGGLKSKAQGMLDQLARG
jgi:pilus assembly protein FimV